MTTSSDSGAAVAELRTERLVLRAWTAVEAATVNTDRRLDDWAEGFPDEGDKVIAPLIAAEPQWLGPFGHRLIVERESGLVVGSLGLFWPPTDGAVELGYGVAPSRRGRGYASEAVRALTAHAFTAPEVRAVFAHVEPSNPASVRVLEKAGFTPTGPGAEEGTVRYDAPAAA
ncbi:GNAT family N-acetyltransferase [Glycomyces algeriensis]|uniref:GNAT family N-acetyltransferase n=1 Tax=Glycomyces algeriensis TaxID=256037 RepID=UPI0022D4483C|nr:GNAT family N-acetyltransferase [Glycomyces algeriensis]MDA1368466.1 GNAT family N-acetyltransferase [Glycomyces algeriensis]MDR7353273.1 RimJ/RimL family protein N-acetyltransferase [Glycomyces algeriensis]